MLGKKRAIVFLIKSIINNRIGQLNQLLLKQRVITLLPYIFEYTINIDLMNT